MIRFGQVMSIALIFLNVAMKPLRLHSPYLSRAEDMRGRSKRWGPSWISFRRLSTNLALWLKKPCFSEGPTSRCSGHSSFPGLKKGSSLKKLLRAACWDIMSALEGLLCCWVEWKVSFGTWSPGFPALYTPAVLTHPFPACLPAISKPWSHSCSFECNQQVRNALPLI